MTATHELDDLLALLGDVPTPEEEARPAPAAAPKHPHRDSGVVGIIPGPSVLSEGLVERVKNDLRAHGIVTGGSAVRVLEAVDLMLTQDEHCRTFARCVIKTIAHRTGLHVIIEDDLTADEAEP